MKKITCNLLDEPTEHVYSQLISYAHSMCDSFLLVIRHSINLNSHATKLLDFLKPFLVESEELSKWPGTELTNGSTALVNKYELNENSAKILQLFANSLYSWQQPYLPEDLCFLNSDGSPWMVSISHESDSYFEITEQEKVHLLKEIPDLKI